MQYQAPRYTDQSHQIAIVMYIFHTRRQAYRWVLVFAVTVLASISLLLSPISAGDAYWTPLRSIFIVLDTKLSSLKAVEQFLHSTVHNDSMKLFPALIESLLSVSAGRWEPILSVLAGWILWLFCIYLTWSVLNRSTALVNTIFTSFASPIIVFLMMTGTPQFFSRFSTVFAVHRVLPVLCALICAKIIFHENKELKINNITALSLCCFVAQFSFASGQWLWIACALSLAFRLNIRTVKGKRLMVYFLLAMAASWALYLQYFDSTHASALTDEQFPKWMRNPLHQIFLSIRFLLDFAFFCLSPIRQIVITRSPPTQSVILLSTSILLLTIFIKVLVMPISMPSVGRLKSRLSLIIGTNKLVFFMLFSLFPAALANIVARGQTIVPSRYFVEAVIFSIFFISLLISLSMAYKLKIISYSLQAIIIISAIGNFSFLVHTNVNFAVAGRQQSSFETSIECVRQSQDDTYETLYSACKWYKVNPYFLKDNETVHPFVKIYDLKDYSHQVFKVVRGY